MTIDEWNALTPERAARMLGAAARMEQKAAERYGFTGNEGDEAHWKRALAFHENLLVFVRAGVKVSDPYDPDAT